MHGYRARFSGFAPRYAPLLRYDPWCGQAGAARDQPPGGLNPTDSWRLSPMGGNSPASFGGSAAQTAGDSGPGRALNPVGLFGAVAAGWGRACFGLGLEPAASSGHLRSAGAMQGPGWPGRTGRAGTAGRASGGGRGPGHRAIRSDAPETCRPGNRYSESRPVPIGEL